MPNDIKTRGSFSFLVWVWRIRFWHAIPPSIIFWPELRKDKSELSFQGTSWRELVRAETDWYQQTALMRWVISDRCPVSSGFPDQLASRKDVAPKARTCSRNDPHGEIALWMIRRWSKVLGITSKARNHWNIHQKKWREQLNPHLLLVIPLSWIIFPWMG